MVYPSHTRITFSGVFGNLDAPAEIWAVRLNAGDMPAGTNLATVAGSARGQFGVRVLPLMPSYVRLTRTRVSQHLEGTGLTVNNGPGGYAQADDFTTYAGTGSSSTVLPLQTAICVSLGTDRAGPTGKGRIFLPSPSGALTGDFNYSTSVQAAVLNAVGLLIEDLNAVALPGNIAPGVSVVSSKGYLSRVTSVRVGAVPDTMRSRRSARLEGYVSRPVALE